MKKWLIYAMLLVTPFLIIPGMDSRSPKMALAGVFLSALLILAFYEGFKLSKITNYGLLAFIGLIPLNVLLAPKMSFEAINLCASYSYIYKTVSLLVLFIFGYLIIREFIKENPVHKLNTILIWSGFLMSSYCIIQALGMDQFLMVKRSVFNSDKSLLYMIFHLDSPLMVGGTLGHPTLVSPFIGMLLPLAIKERKWLFVIVMSIAVIICLSMVAFAALLFSAMFFCWLKFKSRRITIGIYMFLFLCCICLFAFTHPIGKRVLNNSGRLKEWSQIIKTSRTPLVKDGRVYSLTGIGAGSFRYIYPLSNKTTFLQAHNEYLEVFFDYGLLGLGALIAMIIIFFLKNLNKNPYYLTSLFFICFCATGTFVWHIIPISLYTIVIKSLTEVEE